MTYDTKNTIDSLGRDDLVKLYKFIKLVIDSGRANYSQRVQLLEIQNYIEKRIAANNIRVPSGNLSDSDFYEASGIFDNIKLSSNTKYENNNNKSDIFETMLGFGVFILIIIVIAVIKGIFDFVINLWNSGILKIILGASLIGIGTYGFYKEGIFETIKTKIDEYKKKKGSIKKNNGNSKRKTKDKEENLGIAFVKEAVKDLTIYSSAIVVLGTGMAHLEKHTNVLDNTFLENIGKNSRCTYEKVSRFVREKNYELFNDYSEFDNMGNMEYLDPNNSYNYHNLTYQNDDVYLSITNDDSWEGISEYCYGNPSFAQHLKLYNAHYNFDDDYLHEGDMIMVPNLEKLEDYIYSKKLIKSK